LSSRLIITNSTDILVDVSESETQAKKYYRDFAITKTLNNITNLPKKMKTNRVNIIKKITNSIRVLVIAFS
jgi:hypothetical protein